MYSANSNKLSIPDSIYYYSSYFLKSWQFFIIRGLFVKHLSSLAHPRFSGEFAWEVSEITLIPNIAIF